MGNVDEPYSPVQSHERQVQADGPGFFDEMAMNVSQWAESINEEWFGEDGFLGGDAGEQSWWSAVTDARIKEEEIKKIGPVSGQPRAKPTSAHVATLTRDQLKIKWAYGFYAMARNEFPPELSAAIEAHFRMMREVENTPTDIQFEMENGDKWAIDFFNMRATCEKYDGIYSWDLVREFPDTQFVPYTLPQTGDALAYLDNSPIPVPHEELFALFLRWDGSDNAWESYKKPMWGLYSPRENYILEKSYQDWIKTNTRDVNYKIDAAYSINFRAMVQFRTNNVYRQRAVKRILFRWYWKDDNDKWIPYNEQQSVAIERALVNNHAEVEIEVESEKYTLNLLEMTQCHSSNNTRRRSVLRVGPPLSQQLLVINADDEADEHGNFVLLHINQSFPHYWELPCKQATQVPVNFKTSLLGKQISALMNNTIFPKGHGDQFGAIAGKDPKGFEITSIHIIQNPSMWSNYMYQKGKVVTSFSEAKNDDHPLATPTIDGKYNEVYLFHGNKISAIERMCSDGFGISFRNAHISGFGGLYFTENSSTANTYAPCPNCNRNPCDCAEKYQREAEFSILLCRVILGNVYIDEKFSHNDYDQRGKSPASGMGYHTILGVPADQRHPRELIITNHSSVYPEFLIRYKRKEEPIESVPIGRNTPLGKKDEDYEDEEEKDKAEEVGKESGQNKAFEGEDAGEIGVETEMKYF